MNLATTARPILVIGLDGLEISYAEKLMNSGDLPALAALRDRSAQFLLDHGPAQRTGLAWEHVASGLSPQNANRWSAVDFNVRTYGADQRGASFTPFFESDHVRTVVFDPPYVDLRKTTQVEGIVGWGAHDPGTDLVARPASLHTQLQAKFGDYPAPEYIYCCPAYSAEQCQKMGEALVKAVEVRRQAALWLLSEKRDTCDLFYVVTGELHSAIEGLWHGIDPQHPMYSHPSAPAAANALKDIHRAVDRFVADLVEAAGDSPVVAFAMGGMGANESDLQSMVLLPELLYRQAFHKSLIHLPQNWTQNPTAVPQLKPNQTWSASKRAWYGAPKRRPLLERGFQRIFKRPFPFADTQATESSLYWQPAMAYQPWWSKMDAFALPSFYDGRLRINLIGREKNGKVSFEDYAATCDEIEAMIRQCHDPRTGKPVVAKVERPQIADPRDLDLSDADMVIVWQGISNAFEHPEHGLVGPVPFRRTGGHTGLHGVAYLAGAGLKAGFHGTRSSFDVVPTIAEMAGLAPAAHLSGTSLINKAEVQAAESVHC